MKSRNDVAKSKVCLLQKLRVLSLAYSLWTGFIAIIRGVRSPQTGSLITGRGILAAIGLLVIALMCAVEFYGIHTRAVFAWKLGWVILTAGFLRFLVDGGSSALQVPETDHPWVAFGAVMVGGSVVAVYWGFWWKRQKDYFTAQSPAIPRAGTKELAVVLCIAALVLAGVGLISGPVAKYHELGNQAVKQFHEQLAAGQYTKFTNGTGTEQFAWQAYDNHVTLGRYQIKSSVLTSR